MANNFINDQGSRTTRTTGALQITDTRQKNIIPCNPSHIFARGIGLNTSRDVVKTGEYRMLVYTHSVILAIPAM